MINISQIFISDRNEPVPKLFEESVSTVKKNLIHTNHRIYIKEDLEKIIYENFPEEVFKSFKKLNPYSYKKDLAVYCLGYLFGGWFIDISIKIKLCFDIGQLTEIDFLSFRDYGQGALHPRSLNYPLTSGLFYTKPNSKIMSKAIDLIVENCKNEFYGSTSSCPTGPSILGRAHSNFGTKRNQLIGFFLPLTPDFEQKNRSFILPSGHIFASNKDSWFSSAKAGDLKEFGAKGTNNHLTMYSEKNIYDCNILI